MDYKELRRKIETFSLDDGDLGSQGYKRVLLQVFGLTGHGKSSFINSCKYILNDGGAYKEFAESGQRSDGNSMTMIRKAYELTSNITIVDNRGYKVINSFERVGILFQLGNFYPLDQRVEWKNDFDEAKSDLIGSNLDKNATDFLVPIFISSAAHTMSHYEQDDVRALLLNCDEMTGVFPIVVLTHKTRGDFMEVAKQFRLMGAETVIAIENYTKDKNVKTLGKSTDILMIIQKALENVSYRLSLPRDPERDCIERKQFLDDYIHKSEIQYEKERERERERAKNNNKEEEKKEPGFFERLKSCVLQ